MKGIRLLCGIILGCLLATLFITGTVRADLIWTPNDDFFNKHFEECERLGRSYMANGHNGYVEIKKNPLSEETIANKENETEFYVSFTYTGPSDRVWGVVEFDNSTGWIVMEDLLVIYDNISFMEEHEGDIEAFQGEWEDYVSGKEPVQFYPYPGSGKSTSAMDIKEDKPVVSYTYEDDEGRLWGYVNYYFSHKGWICLSDPRNANISGSKEAPQATLIPKASELPDPSYPLFSRDILVIVLLVAAVVVGTGMIIRIFWKKK